MGRLGTVLGVCFIATGRVAEVVQISTGRSPRIALITLAGAFVACVGGWDPGPFRQYAYRDDDVAVDGLVFVRGPDQPP